MTKDTDALREALEQVKQLAQRDMARTQTDFIGRMGQELCDFEAAIEPYPDGELPDDVRGDAYDAISGLAGLAFAQMLMLRGCDHTIFATPASDPDTIGSHFGNGGGFDGGASGGDVAPVAWQFDHPTYSRSWDVGPLTDHAKSKGWTETPLYARPPHPAPVDQEEGQ